MQSNSSSHAYRNPREHFPDEEGTEHAVNAAIMNDIRSLLHVLTTKQSTGVTTMPFSDNAPKFRGNNLRRFLENYSLIAETAGWTDVQKCEHIYKYCNKDTRDLVRALDPRKRGNWTDTVVALQEMYIYDEQTDRYTRDSLEKFISEKRVITKKMDFVKYYRGFIKQLHGLREKITEEEKNRLFWKGIPEALQDDIYRRLLAANPLLDSHSPPDRRKVHELALKSLDKKSVYANLMASQGHRRRMEAKSTRTRQRSSKSSKPWLDDSDDEEPSSEDDNRRHKHKRSISEDSESGDEVYTSDNYNSDSESSGDEQVKHSKAHKKKKATAQQTLKPTKSHLDSLKKNLGPTSTKDDSKDNVIDLANEFRQLRLMLSQSSNPQQEEIDIPRNAKFINDPAYKQLAQMMQKVALEVQENRNDTQLLLDHRQLKGPEFGKFGRCFFCHLSGTHPRGIIYCPEAQATVQEGYCAFRNGRLFMVDGRDLPRAEPGQTLAATIRNLHRDQRSSVAGARVPARTSQVAYAEIWEPEESDYYDYESDIPEANPALWQHVFAADRTEKPKTRFDPMHKEKRPQGQNRVRPTPYVEVPPIPKQWGDQKVPLHGPQPRQNPPPSMERPRNPPSVPNNDTKPPPKILKPTRIPEKPTNHPSNNVPSVLQERRAGGLRNQPNIQKSDFVMREDPRRPNPGPERTIQPPRLPAKNRFTTNMRQNYAGDHVYKKVLGTDVTLPLGELLAVCPDIEKTLSSDTKLRTVPVTHAQVPEQDDEMAEAFAGLAPSSEDNDYEDSFHPGGQEYYQGPYYTAAASMPVQHGFSAKSNLETQPTKNAPISATGSFVVKIGDREIVAMVDSGAEMNMITPTLAEELRYHYAEDENGKKFKMKNVSGVVSQLNGRFNDIPLLIGGHQIPETFFVGEQWDSHFDAILGQTFLNNRACEMSWNGSDHILMRLYPSGNKEGDAIIVRLTKHNNYDRRAMTARIGIAEIFPMSNLELDHHDADHESPISMPADSASLDPSFVWTGYASEPPGDTENNSNQTAYMPTSENVSEADWTREFTMDDTLASMITGIDYNSFWDDIEEAGTAKEESHLRELDYMAAMNAQQPSMCDPLNPHDMDVRFYRAVAALKRSGQLDINHNSYEEVQEAYNSRIFKAFHHVPVGDQVLNIDEGEHTVRINSKSLRAVLDPRLNHNLITRTALRRAGLETNVIPQEDLEEGEIADIEYCSPVLIELGIGPLLPGIFMVTDSPIPGGYDLLLGKPWMMGIECYFTYFRFNRSLNDFVYEPPSPDINPDVLVLATADVSQGSGRTPPSDIGLTAKQNRALRRLKRLGYVHHANITNTPAQQEEGQADNSPNGAPALGGVIAKTL